MTGREVRLRRDACTFGKFRNWYFAQKDFKKSFKNIKRRGKIFPFFIWNLVSESTNEDISASRAATHFHSLAFNNLIFRMSDYGRLFSIYWIIVKVPLFCVKQRSCKHCFKKEWTLEPITSLSCTLLFNQIEPLKNGPFLVLPSSLSRD